MRPQFSKAWHWFSKAWHWFSKAWGRRFSKAWALFRKRETDLEPDLVKREPGFVNFYDIKHRVFTHGVIYTKIARSLVLLSSLHPLKLMSELMNYPVEKLSHPSGSLTRHISRVQSLQPTSKSMMCIHTHQVVYRGSVRNLQVNKSWQEGGERQLSLDALLYNNASKFPDPLKFLREKKKWRNEGKEDTEIDELPLKKRGLLVPQAIRTYTYMELYCRKSTSL